MAHPTFRTLIQRTIPSHFRHPFGLAKRVWQSGGAEGRFAMLLAGLGLVATPLDLLLAPLERRLYRRASMPRLPMIFVCGPPRSGTTVVAQALARALPVAYFTNFTSLFPRSPVTASRIFRVRPRSDAVTLSSHYGRSVGMRGPNDGLYLWDRWLGGDRMSTVQRLEAVAARDLAQFFGAYEAWAGRSLVTKNNSLNAHAALIGAQLPTARFICLDRDPVFLAQSLLIARSHIHGDEMVAYGLHDGSSRGRDPVGDVCRQVRFHQQLAKAQLAQLGPERFEILSYETFCANPAEIVAKVAGWLEVVADESKLPGALGESRSRRVAPGVFARLEQEFSGA